MTRVLVVDDEKSIRTTLGEFLRMDGYDVQMAEDADAALALMAQCAFDVVVTDIILPRASGVTLLQQIREQAPDIQVVMMTGEPTVDTAVQAVRAGAHDYLSKPVSKRDLLAAVGRAARFKALMDEKHRLEAENRQYQENLERLVGERTETLAARTRQLEALLRATRSVMSGLDLHGILDRILTEAAVMGGCPNVKVFLVDRKAGALRVEAFQGMAVSLVGSVLPLGTGLTGLAAQTGQPVFSEDLTQDPRNPVPEQDRELGFVTYLGLPIRIRDEVLGVLTFRTTTPRHYTPDEVAYLTSFADQSAIAIENARLYEAVRQHAAELEDRVQERTRELEAANQQLQDASRHKSEFLANMSHELRTPLNSIIGFAELLREQGVGPLTERQARYLTHIWNGGKHLLQLISDILDLSKVEAGKFILQPEPLPVGQTLEDILVIARGLANKKAQEIQVEIAPDLPPLHADPVRFKQILFNLLSNAVKFTPEKGTITLRAYQKAESRRQKAEGSGQLAANGDQRPEGGRQKAEGSGQTSGELPPLPTTECPLPTADCLLPSLVIEVTDTGVGIRPEDLPKLFQEFVQLETTQAQRHEGTGLGLALTRRLVELHGGRIWAESEGEGRGSTFTVVLPFAGPGT